MSLFANEYRYDCYYSANITDEDQLTAVLVAVNTYLYVHDYS